MAVDLCRCTVFQVHLLLNIGKVCAPANIELYVCYCNTKNKALNANTYIFLNSFTSMFSHKWKKSKKPTGNVLLYGSQNAHPNAESSASTISVLAVSRLSAPFYTAANRRRESNSLTPITRADASTECDIQLASTNRPQNTDQSTELIETYIQRKADTIADELRGAFVDAMRNVININNGIDVIMDDDNHPDDDEDDTYAIADEMEEGSDIFASGDGDQND